MMDVELSQDDVQNIVNAYDKDIKKMKQQENEIARLNNLNKQLVEECQRLDDEETRLNNIINELEKYLWEVRQLTFTKYSSNEWNNCLSFNDDIKPILDKLKELKNGDNNG